MIKKKMECSLRFLSCHSKAVSGLLTKLCRSAELGAAIKLAVAKAHISRAVLNLFRKSIDISLFCTRPEGTTIHLTSSNRRPKPVAIGPRARHMVGSSRAERNLLSGVQIQLQALNSHRNHRASGSVHGWTQF